MQAEPLNLELQTALVFMGLVDPCQRAAHLDVDKAHQQARCTHRMTLYLRFSLAHNYTKP